ncbi:acyl-CoA synthetase short-chain family member 2 [Mycena leptocephala]|nr:acyl-CoA synthetase short-chain family member 2 [Mycena leptocephala]
MANVHCVPSYCPLQIMAPLFILYISGSTRKPKGVVHTTGGYLLCAALNVKYLFDVHPDDCFACMADLGHALLLLLAATRNVLLPAGGISSLGLGLFGVAPPPLHLPQVGLGAHHVTPHDLSSLRVLGSVGELVNPEAWNWYNEHMGEGSVRLWMRFGSGDSSYGA